MRRMGQAEVAEGKVEEGPPENKLAAQHPTNTIYSKTSNVGSLPSDEAAVQTQGAEVLLENACGGQECSLQHFALHSALRVMQIGSEEQLEHLPRGRQVEIPVQLAVRLRA